MGLRETQTVQDINPAPQDGHDDAADGPWLWNGDIGKHLGTIRDLFVELDEQGELVAFTDGKLAKRAGCSKGYIQQIMNGKLVNVSVAKLLGICEAFDGQVPPTYFFSEKVRRRVNRRLDARRDALRREQAARAREE